MRKLIYTFFCLIFLFGGGIAESMNRSSIESIDSAIGVKTLHYVDIKRGDRPVVVELWYPVADSGVSDRIEDLYIHPSEARDATFVASGNRYPLILMSHGHRGDRRDRSWLAEKRVKKNYIVASVEHYGNSSKTFDPALTLRYWDRPQDVSFALDQLLNEPDLKEVVDADRIGFVGYSLGGMTGLSLAGGGVQDLTEIFAKYRKEFNQFPRESFKVLDTSIEKGSVHDPRIKAYLLLAPATFLFSQEGLKKITAPIGLVSAINDEVLPHEEHARRVLQNSPTVRFKLLRKEIAHSAFLNPLSALGKQVKAKSKRQALSSEDQKRLYQEVGDFSISFFQDQLRDGQTIN